MKLKKWEIALAIGLLLSVAVCALPVSAQQGISEKMIRLHILANSDSEDDQALKIAVRDAVLQEIGEQDDRITPQLLARLEQTARKAVAENGYDYHVSLSRQRMYFDTRRYEGFALPAGNYDAVRIIIGEGEGKNWWCVLFPPLCAGVCEEELNEIAIQAGLTGDEISFIREDGTVYVVQFKIAEAFGRIKAMFS